MYRINNLSRNVLITTDEVVAQVAMDENPAITVLEQSIIVAEERFIKPAICRDLYEAIRTAKNITVTDANKAALSSQSSINLNSGQILNAIELVTDPNIIILWNEYLWKLTAECVVYIATIPNWSRFSASGQMVNNPKTITDGTGAASVDLLELKYKITKTQQDVIDPLIASMKEFLAINFGKYPLFNCHRDLCEVYSPERNAGVSVARKTSWIHVYDRPRHRDHNCDCDYDQF